jgi:hypothetical protein
MLGVAEDQKKNDTINVKKVNRMAKSAKSRDIVKNAHTIPKGTKMYRVSSNDSEQIKGSTYVTYLEPDRYYYKSGYIRARDKSPKEYEYTMQLKEDLKVPSKDKVDQVIKDKILTNDDLVKESIESWLDEIVPKNSQSRINMSIDEKTGEYDPKVWTKFVDDIVDSSGDRTIDSAIVQTYQSLGMAKNVKKVIIDELKSEGYNAMVDIAGVGSSNNREGYAPMIVFDSKKSLEVTDTKEVSLYDNAFYGRESRRWRQYANDKNKEW